MKWGIYDLYWGRPLKSILTVFDGKKIDYDFYHLKSSNNTYIGAYSDCDSNNLKNSVAIGCYSKITKDHQIKGSDLYYLKKGYISVTPLALNVTDYSSLHKMREILE